MALVCTKQNNLLYHWYRGEGRFERRLRANIMKNTGLLELAILFLQLGPGTQMSLLCENMLQEH